MACHSNSECHNQRSMPSYVRGPSQIFKLSKSHCWNLIVHEKKGSTTLNNLSSHWVIWIPPSADDLVLQRKMQLISVKFDVFSSPGRTTWKVLERNSLLMSLCEFNPPTPPPKKKNICIHTIHTHIYIYIHTIYDIHIYIYVVPLGERNTDVRRSSSRPRGPPLYSHPTFSWHSPRP